MIYIMRDKSAQIVQLCGRRCLAHNQTSAALISIQSLAKQVLEVGEPSRASILPLGLRVDLAALCDVHVGTLVVEEQEVALAAQVVSLGVPA